MAAQATPAKPNAEGIRIGTMTPCEANYIKQILPHGFESFELNFWQTIGQTDLKESAKEITDLLAGTDAVVSCIGIYGNPLDPNAEAHEETLASWKTIIDHAHVFGCDLVCGFAGAIDGKPIPESMPAYKKVFGELAKQAADAGVRIAFENCEMGGTWDAARYNIATIPDAWEMMFNELPADNVGLEWEPCHQRVKLIDPLPQLRKYVDKVFHVHGKDATICRETLKTHGINGPEPFAWHRTPGFGESNWTDIITILRMGGFNGSIDVEGWHDPVYKGELEMTGQVHALNHLKTCRGGSFVENPQ